MAKKTQTDVILLYLLDGNRITSMNAFSMFGATRLSAIIWTLRHGYEIPVRSKLLNGVNRLGNNTTFSEYWIDEEYLNTEKARDLYTKICFSEVKNG